MLYSIDAIFHHVAILLTMIPVNVPHSLFHAIILRSISIIAVAIGIKSNAPLMYFDVPSILGDDAIFSSSCTPDSIYFVY